MGLLVDGAEARRTMLLSPRADPDACLDACRFDAVTTLSLDDGQARVTVVTTDWSVHADHRGTTFTYRMVPFQLHGGLQGHLLASVVELDILPPELLIERTVSGGSQLQMICQPLLETPTLRPNAADRRPNDVYRRVRRSDGAH